MSPRAVLLTGFEAFGEQPLNASRLAVEAVDPARVSGARVVTAVLPCVFGDATEALERALRRHRPAVVICCGQAGGRAEIAVERVAINVDDAVIPDNVGARPIDRPIAAGGPAAYFSTLPIKAIVAALRAEGLPAAVSQTAGTFVCNHVFYGLMHRLARRRGVRGGFIHVPWVPEQVSAPASDGHDMPCLPVAEIARALEIAAQVSLDTERDLVVAGGATH